MAKIDTVDTRREALKRAISIVGSQAALAEQLAKALQRPIRQSHVSNWLNRDSQVTPAEACMHIQHLTRGGVEAADLRPDIFAPPARSLEHAEAR